MSKNSLGYWWEWNDAKNRSAFGLGWEYRRHNCKKAENPFNRETQYQQWKDFMNGFDQFKCKSAEINKSYGVDNGATR